MQTIAFRNSIIAEVNCHTTTDNQFELTREREWQRRMAMLESIHDEISPQLEALRAFDEDSVLGFASSS